MFAPAGVEERAAVLAAGASQRGGSSPSRPIMEHDITTNAGRCDICGEPIDMRDSDDVLTVQEFGIQDESVKEEHDLTDDDAINAVADAMEREADSGAGYDLAETIRENGEIRTHRDCLESTNFTNLETEV